MQLIRFGIIITFIVSMLLTSYFAMINDKRLTKLFMLIMLVSWGASYIWVVN